MNNGENGMTNILEATLTIFAYITVSRGVSTIIIRPNYTNLKTSSFVYNNKLSLDENYAEAFRLHCQEYGWDGTFVRGTANDVAVWTKVTPQTKVRVKNNLKLKG